MKISKNLKNILGTTKKSNYNQSINKIDLRGRWIKLLVFDTAKMKKYIDSSGIKQKSISEKAGIPEPALSLILQGKRKCEIGEYASIC